MKKLIISIVIIVLLPSLTLWTGCTKNTPKRIAEVKGDYLCISMSNFMEAIIKIANDHEKLPADIETLFGMSWLDGYVVDKENMDIILVGKCMKNRPTYHAEDLLVNLHNVFDSTGSPYCSLDPKPENIKQLNVAMNNESADFEATIRNCQAAIGGQQVVVGGVPRNSRHARIMIYADYDMKKLSQGLIQIPGIRSCIDISISNAEDALEKGSSMSRFWFHIKEKKDGITYPNYIENEGIVFINECPVVVLTEKQMVDAEGNTSDNTSEEDSDADTFAMDMSRNYSKITEANKLFAELENLFRLQACLKSMKFKDVVFESKRNVLTGTGLNLMHGDELPPSLPGLINYKILEKEEKENGTVQISKQLYLVCGGVSQEMETKENSFISDPSISKHKNSIINTRPELSSIFWITNIF